MALVEIIRKLEKTRNRENFFKMIERIYAPNSFQYHLIQKAYTHTKEAFREKLREDGERYFEHLRAVVVIMIYIGVRDYRLIISGLLHDIIEDTDREEDWVRKEFGLHISRMVRCVTKPDENDWEKMIAAYEKQLLEAPKELRVYLIKLADRLHNTITLWACNSEKQERKIKETINFYLPWAKEHNVLFVEILEAVNMINALLEMPRGQRE